MCHSQPVPPGPSAWNTREEAEELMTQTDKVRAQHCLHYTGHEWTDINSYHLMIDSAMAGSEAGGHDLCGAVCTSGQCYGWHTTHT